MKRKGLPQDDKFSRSESGFEFLLMGLTKHQPIWRRNLHEKQWSSNLNTRSLTFFELMQAQIPRPDQRDTVKLSTKKCMKIPTISWTKMAATHRQFNMAMEHESSTDGLPIKNWSSLSVCVWIFIKLILPHHITTKSWWFTIMKRNQHKITIRSP